jgi:hypothetical protein
MLLSRTWDAAHELRLSPLLVAALAVGALLALAVWLARRFGRG